MARALQMIMNGKTFCAVTISVLFAFAVLSCWDANNPMRAGQNGPGVPVRPDHNVNFGGKLHAAGYCQPYQNCALCHGSTLAGGTAGQPSCTKCHLDNWNGSNCGTVIHTINKDGHLHAPGYCQPLQNCAQCHGSTLRGGTAGQPSCYECHDAKWLGGECGD
jgi:hypothetical protein